MFFVDNNIFVITRANIGISTVCQLKTFRSVLSGEAYQVVAFCQKFTDNRLCL